MPRPIRIQSAGYVHHVFSKGTEHQDLFSSQEDYETYLTLVDEARTKFPIKVYNYALLPNHIHLLVEPMEDGSLSKAMEYVSKGYAKYLNKKLNRTGYVFDGRFKSFVIQVEKFFFACSRFIDMNPVKWEVVENPDQYEWSGFSALGYGKEGILTLDNHEIYENMGETPEERQIVYRGMVKSYTGDDLEQLERRAGILGDKDFKKKVKESK